jgi:photoactive yellow protein
MTSPALPSFDTPQLAAAIEALPEAMLDRLPFGAIRMDSDGIVQVYSGAERRLSGLGERPRLGLDFFTGVAPCMDNPRFRGRIEKVLAEGRLDLEFGWAGDFADETRSLRVRIQSAAAGGYWICMLRED